MGVISIELFPGWLEGIGWKKPIKSFDTSVFPYEIGIQITTIKMFLHWYESIIFSITASASSKSESSS